ncbi:hypothetical protein EAY82_18550 [Vibrio anguillarum]|nr:hypothetical protein [Vibrio anguillarum]MBF4409744.1 hypothetical protein [Vibrio anguillarum]
MTSEDILHIIQDEMGEKVIASVTLSDAGSLIVQYGDKVVVYKTPTSMVRNFNPNHQVWQAK